MNKFGALISGLGYLAIVGKVFAQDSGRTGIVDNINLGTAQGSQGIFQNTPLNLIIGNAITIVFTVAAILVLAMLIWGGIEWVLSGGDKEKVANARKRIISALIGLAIIALAFLILRVVGSILNFNVLSNLTIPTLDRGAEGKPVE